MAVIISYYNELGAPLAYFDAIALQDFIEFEILVASNILRQISCYSSFFVLLLSPFFIFFAAFLLVVCLIRKPDIRITGLSKTVSEPSGRTIINSLRY